MSPAATYGVIKAFRKRSLETDEFTAYFFIVFINSENENTIPPLKLIKTNQNLS
jgi:hypothetical protein